MNGKTLYSTNSKEDAEINLQKIEKESNGFIYGLEIVEQPKGKQPTQTRENTTSIESVSKKYLKGQQTDPSDLDDIREDYEDGKITKELLDIS